MDNLICSIIGHEFRPEKKLTIKNYKNRILECFRCKIKIKPKYHFINPSMKWGKEEVKFVRFTHEDKIISGDIF